MSSSADEPRPVALVTGASSGLGEVFARKLSARDYDLILLARREDRLRDLAAQLSTHVEVLAADLATDEGVTAAERAIRNCPRLELLVNNAGFGTLGRFWDADLASQEDMHKVHVMAAMRLTHAALREMVPRKRGAIVNVSSVAAFSQNQGSVSYCSTKAWMNSFTLGLDLELRGIGSPVKVQALCPGFTETEFHATLGTGREGIPRFLWLKPEYIVEASLLALKRGNPILIPNWKYKVAAALMTYLPGALTRGVRPGTRDSRVRQ